MFGGRDNTIKLDDAWELTDAGWVQLSPQLSPSPRAGHTMVYDSRQSAMVVFGGSNLAVSQDDTWSGQFVRRGAERDACRNAGDDSDHDGLYGCGALLQDDPRTPMDDRMLLPDPDCWARCTPDCPTWTTAADSSSMTSVGWPRACTVLDSTTRRCGDGQCDTAFEDKQLCPQDC